MSEELDCIAILKLTIREIKYYYEIDTNREFLKRIGYTSPTYLSDIFSGKTSISDKFLAKLQEVFMVNPGIFKGESFDMFIPDSPIQVKLSMNGRSTIKTDKNLHIHVGNTNAETGGTAIESIVAETIAKDNSEWINKIAQMHSETLSGFKEALELNNKILEQLSTQKMEFQRMMSDELKSQRELFMKLLTFMEKSERNTK